MKDKLGQAEAARQALEECEASLVFLKVPPGAVDELQALEVELATLRAAREARRPSIAIAYETDAASPVTMDGHPLNDGEERGYDGQAQLSVPGVGMITLRTNSPVRGDDRLEQTQAKRRTLLASIGVDDLAGARERQARMQQLESDRRELQARLSLLAPEGLARLREEVAARSSAGAEVLELKADPTQARLTLADAQERYKDARQALHEAEPLRESAEESFVTAETTLATLNAERAQAEAVLGPEEARDERERALSTTLDECTRAYAEAEAHEQGLRAVAVDLESCEAALTRARSVEASAQTQANGLRQEIAELQGRIRAYSADAVEEEWREASDALAAAKARVEAFEREVAILQRLMLALEQARAEAREVYLKPVMAELRPLLGLLFDDVSVTFDERSLLPQTILRNGQAEDVDRLSGGMREQLSVLTRLAFARLLAQDGRPAPVILDDALVYSDDDRIEKMFDALHRQSRDQQIIVFSCRQRAFQRLGGTALQMTDWRPTA